MNRRARFGLIFAAFAAVIALLFYLGWLQGAAAFIFFIGLCVLFHEVGHFVVAKLCRMGVPEFAVGFGPSLASFRSGETEYHFRVLPLGGYVKIAGFEPGEDQEAPGGFFTKPRWMGALTLVAGSFMNVVLAALLFAITGAVWGEITGTTNVVERVMENSPAEAAGMQAGDIIVAVDGQRFGTQLAQVRRGSAASRAGLRPGDYILKINDVEVAGRRELRLALEGAVQARQPIRVLFERDLLQLERTMLPPQGKPSAEDVLGLFGISCRPLEPDDIRQIILSSPERRLTISVMRGARQVKLSVLPQSILEKVPRKTEEGKIVFDRRKVGQIGIVFQAEWRRLGVGESIAGGCQRAVGWVALMVMFLREMILGNIAPEGGGPVAIAVEMSKAARMGLYTVLNQIAIISVNLAIINLLPIPILDGGHLTILGYEAILRRRISERSRTAVLVGGLVFIVAVFLLITARDIFDLVLQKIS